MAESIIINLDINGFLLRNWLPNDARSLAKYANNKKIWLNLRDEFPYPFIEEDAVKFINKFTSSNNLLYLAIANEFEAVGNIGVNFYNDVRRKSAVLSYWIGEPFWNRGIATEAIKKYCEYIFYNLDIIRIYAKFFERNIGSQRALEKAGFMQEGHFRKAIIKQGKILDQYLYAKVI